MFSVGRFDATKLSFTKLTRKLYGKYFDSAGVHVQLVDVVLTEVADAEVAVPMTYAADRTQFTK